MTIHYTIIPKDLAGHLFQVTVRVDQPDPIGQVFILPAWIPGSYMVREFARNIVQIKASCNGKKVRLTKLDKHSWQAVPVSGSLTLEYEVYAWDLSVRTAHLDQTHGFYNGTSVFLRVVGQEMDSHVVDIQKPVDPACKQWRVATSLPLLKAKLYGFGSYVAENYDALIDHPVEMGEFAMASFSVHGVPHDFVVTGRVPNLDLDRIVRDLEKICATQIAFFEPKTKRAPMDRYVFMTMAVGDGYGGLEHRASTALICNRTDLPVKGNEGNEDASEAYISFLGLCSHEYFHTWNVKRIKPAAFAAYDLQQENYTPLLWLFEGITSYYDDLILLRSGIIDESAYLNMVSKTLNGVLRGAGRTKQSLADSSFDAWTKYYRQDENSPNAIVSYYTKGSLLALALDLTIRQTTAGKKSLDDLMRALWQTFGRDFYKLALTGDQQGVTEAQVEAMVEQICGVKMKPFFDRYVRGTADLPLDDMYADFGVGLVDQRKVRQPSLGVKLSREANDCKLAQVFNGRAAHAAGMSAGDVIVAIDGLRVSATDVPTNLSKLLGRYAVGARVVVHAFRRDELMQFTVRLQSDDVPMWALQVNEQDPASKSRVKVKQTAQLARPSSLKSS
ncbi:M61 family metallopeptidase [Solimicrobium silvestre]|uniref:Putative protease with the C-terminal PDZ domain n=1 Tax=Solimicrobium silvestre TaxID=2099400 RepID=A0A2S9H1S6_9BURK|nr:M61 family metallopeptidase [Solimicrobium silvestre]PRC93945.1 putative protease with the C-terminal PDZ domain [Solimicrobium silvestre]